MISYPAVTAIQVATPVSTQQISNSSDITDQGLRKKLKSVDGVAMCAVKDNVDVDGEGSVHGASQRYVKPSFVFVSTCILPVRAN